MPASLWALGETRMAMLFAVLSLIVWIKHKTNITRLIAGTEGKIGQKS